MESKLDEVITAALQLGIEERAQLAGGLLFGLSNQGTAYLILDPR